MFVMQKKGGNVKTIPPYKPVAHDSQSSESSSEKEEGASPMPGGSGTPSPHTKGSKGVCVQTQMPHYCTLYRMISLSVHELYGINARHPEQYSLFNSIQ